MDYGENQKPHQEIDEAFEFVLTHDK